MILHVDPQAPLLLRAGAEALLFAHIAGASTGLVAGPIALVAKKGGPLHRWSGNAFFAGMLAMSAVGATVAPFLDDRGSTMGGLLAFYLTFTGWTAAKRPPGTSGVLEIGGLLFAAAAAALGFSFAWIGAHSPHGLIDGKLPYQLPLVFGLILTLAAAADLRVILKGGLAGAPRLARHLWRMSLATAIAWGSFAAQPKALPPVLRGQPLMILPALVVLGLMVFWLIKVRARRRRKPAIAAAPAGLAPA
jgi:hypothetical protein